MPPKRLGAGTNPYSFYRGNEPSLREMMANAMASNSLRRSDRYHLTRTPFLRWEQTPVGQRFKTLAGSINQWTNAAAGQRVSLPWLANKVASYDRQMRRLRRFRRYR